MDSDITKYFAYFISEVFTTYYPSSPFIILYTFITHFTDENWVKKVQFPAQGYPSARAPYRQI